MNTCANLTTKLKYIIVKKIYNASNTCLFSACNLLVFVVDCVI